VILRSLFAALLLVSVAGCSPQGPAEQRSRPPARSLVIGLVPEHNIFRQLERYEPLGDYLGEKLNYAVTFRIVPDYAGVIDQLQSGEVDGAFLGSLVYVMAHERVGVVPIARPESFDGSSMYHGVIIVRKDSGIDGIARMRGATFAFVDRTTTAGYLLPLNFLKEAGVADPRQFLSEVYFAGTHENAVYDVLERRADVGASKNTVYARLASVDPRVAAELTILDRSPDVPENALALHPSLDEMSREQIRRVLLNMHNDPGGEAFLRWFGARRFVPTSHEEYAPVYRYAARLGLNLAAAGDGTER
jgi:phosphonate transport system substrate-binding protein